MMRKMQKLLRKWHVRVYERGAESFTFSTICVGFTGDEVIALAREQGDFYATFRGTGKSGRELKFPLRFVATEMVEE